MNEDGLLSEYVAGTYITRWLNDSSRQWILPAGMTKAEVLLAYLRNGSYKENVAFEVKAEITYLLTHPESKATENKELLISILEANTADPTIGVSSWENYFSNVSMNSVLAPDTNDPFLNSCYFYSSVLPNNSYITLPVIPNSISDHTSANWTPQSIMGRGAPLAAYGYTDARQVSFSFDMSRDPAENPYCRRGGTISDNTPPVEDLLNSLRSLVYALYDTQAGLIPPITTFNIFDFRSTGYVTSVNYEWKTPLIRDEAYNSPRKFSCVSVSIQMVEVARDNPSASSFSVSTASAPFSSLPLKSVFHGGY